MYSFKGKLSYSIQPFCCILDSNDTNASNCFRIMHAQVNGFVISLLFVVFSITGLSRHVGFQNSISVELSCGLSSGDREQPIPVMRLLRYNGGRILKLSRIIPIGLFIHELKENMSPYWSLLLWVESPWENSVYCKDRKHKPVRTTDSHRFQSLFGTVSIAKTKVIMATMSNSKISQPF